MLGSGTTKAPTYLTPKSAIAYEGSDRLIRTNVSFIIRLVRLFMKRIVLKSQVRTLKLMLFDFTLSVMTHQITNINEQE